MRSVDRRVFLKSAVVGAAGTVLGRARGASASPAAAAEIPIDRDELVELARQLTRIPSFTTEETACARFVHELFQSNGFESRLDEVDPGRFQCIARLSGSGGGASAGTGGGESLMLNGHLDIDPLPSDLDRDPWQSGPVGDMFFGAGVGNMKAGVASMVTSALAAKRAGFPRHGDLIVACVVGELQGGAGTAHLLRSGVHADAAIVTEPHGASNILTKHAGVMQFAVHVIGVSAHISRKDQGINAILEAGKVAQAIEDMEFEGTPDPELPGLPIVNVGSIVGGRGRTTELRGPNIVPDFCTLYADVRFTEGMTPDSVLADVRRTLDALKRSDPKIRYEIEFPMKPERRCLREVMMPFSISPESPLVRKLAGHVEAVRGVAPHVGVSLPSGYSGNDTSHLSAAGIPCCLYGPAGAPDGPERYLWASIDEMMTCARVYASMIADL
jgi:acetylornithine deacetylase